MAAIMLAGVMTLGMTGTVFAGELTPGGTAGSTTGSLTTPDSVTLKKAITVTNYDNYTYEPDITYTYTLSGTQGGGTVSDGVTTVTFKAGSTAYLRNGSEAEQKAVFSSENQVAGSGEANASKDLTWTFDPAAFPSAGVYRYEISETATSAAPESIGIERPEGYDTSKYLDVYVKNGESGLEIYGYALVDDEAGEVAEDSAKGQGWNIGDELEFYATYNLTITKKITGTGADMTAKFPFTVNLSGEMSSANIAGSTGENGADAAISITEGAEGSADAAKVVKEIGNEESIVIKGLPTTVTYSISEENSTLDAYKANVTSVTGTTAVEETSNNNANLAAGNGTFQVAEGAAVKGSTGAIAIEVTNSLEIISPTGVVMRFAPYLFILGAAIFLIMFTRRRREEDEEI